MKFDIMQMYALRLYGPVGTYIIRAESLSRYDSQDGLTQLFRHLAADRSAPPPLAVMPSE